MSEAAYMMLTHTNGDQCIWLDGGWFVPLDAGGEGYDCPHEHPFTRSIVMRRGTGGNRFIEADATRADLMRSINDQLGDLYEWSEETGRAFDLAEVTISTKRIASGLISVSVTADLGTPTPPGVSP